MSLTATDGPSISVQVPLDQVEPPKTDVRDGRPDRRIDSLADSIHSKGQLQPILCHPVNPEEHLDPSVDGEGRLTELLEDDHPMRIVDGLTRYLACKRMHKPTVWAVIVPEEPDDVVFAQLDANTEGIDMQEKEVLETVIQQKEEQGLSFEEVAERVGLAPSTVRKYSACLDSPEILLERWESPQSVIEQGHIMPLKSIRGDTFRELYEEHTDKTPEAVDAALKNEQERMLEWTEKHQWSVGELRQRVQQRRRDLREELTSDTSQDPQARGQTARAETQETGADPSPGDNSGGSGGQTGPSVSSVPRGGGDDVDSCIVCGEDARQKKAVPCCQTHYGTLANAEEAEEALLSSLGADGRPPGADMVIDEIAALDASSLIELAKQAQITPHALVDEIEAEFGQ